MITQEFTWIETYKGIVKWLREKQNNQTELIETLKEIGVDKFNDVGPNNTNIELTEIDPFTFLCYINKYGDARRISILQKLHEKLKLTTKQPIDVIGLPNCNPMKVWLFPYKKDRGDKDIANLWQLFEQVITNKIDEKLLEEIFKIEGVGRGKLSICWFYTNPHKYLTLDSKTCKYLKESNIDYKYDNYDQYKTILKKTKKIEGSFWIISKKAFLFSTEKTKLEVIKSVKECLDAVLVSKNMGLETNGEVYSYYRGQSDDEFTLTPGIYRGQKLIQHEATIIKEMENSFPEEYENCKCMFDKLVKMQHYELPTRLLDITSNPLVALFFACNDEKTKDKDGALFSFEIQNKNLPKYSDSDAVSVVANIALRPYNFNVTAKDFRSLLHDIRTNDKSHFQDSIQETDIESVFFVKPKKNNPRILKQEGAFFLFGINGIKEKPKKLEDSFAFTKYKIPKAAKQQILDHLQILGITEASLFPEIVKAAKFIKLKYS